MRNTESLQWSEIWKDKIKAYRSRPPRTAYFIKHLLWGSIKTSLELGCGSARDSIKLAQYGLQSMATDADEKLIGYLQSASKDHGVRFQTENAMKTTFSDSEFDLVFHNGLVVYFTNGAIEGMVREHLRISKKYVLVMAHNALNKKLQTIFRKKAETDPVFDCRFFEPLELKKLITESVGADHAVTVHKFGGPIDILYNKKIKGIPNPFHKYAPKLSPLFYSAFPWTSVERVAVLIEKP